ncbi:hypothetical protein Tco_0374278 [Tanacetum coccineum]
MADNRTMAKMLHALSRDTEDAIHGNVPKDSSFICPHHGFSELHQLDTFYNSLNTNNQDALDSVVGGNFLDKMPRDGLAIIESKSKTNPVLITECSKTTGNQSRYQGNNFNSNQSRGGNFNQGQVYQPPTNQPLVYQVPPYQAPTPQIQVVSKMDFENYVKENDAVLKNVQNQGQNLQNQMANVTSLLTSLCNNFKNSASTSNSGTLPSQTVTTLQLSKLMLSPTSGKTCEGSFDPLVPTTRCFYPQKEHIRTKPETSMDKLGLEALTPTRMTPSLPITGVPIILGRPFLRTAKALIDLYEETLTLRVGKEELVYYADKSEKNEEKKFVHAISIIDFSKDDPFSGITTIPSDAPFPSSSPMKTSDSTFEEFINEFTLPNSLPPGDDVSIHKKDIHEELFKSLFDFDDNFRI